MAWNPDLYLKFKAERFAPFEDLMKMVRVRPGLRVFDLGCGTGELTRRLADALPESDVLGIDSSEEMLGQAEGFARPGLRFEQRSIEETEGEFDLVFSNAAIQWVDDHAALIPKIVSMVAPGGQVTIQLPANQFHPTHTMIISIATEDPYRSGLGGYAREFPVLRVAEYAELLYANGLAEINCFEKVYPHILPDSEALAEWMSGTALTPYFERMEDSLSKKFVKEYRRRLAERYPTSPVFFGFNRILFSGVKP